MFSTDSQIIDKAEYSSTSAFEYSHRYRNYLERRNCSAFLYISQSSFWMIQMKYWSWDGEGHNAPDRESYENKLNFCMNLSNAEYCTSVEIFSALPHLAFDEQVLKERSIYHEANHKREISLLSQKEATSVIDNNTRRNNSSTLSMLIPFSEYNSLIIKIAL